MTILVTGAAGFIGFHVTRALRAAGRPVIGVDNLNDYYQPALKQARLAQLEGDSGFAFTRLDVSDREQVLPFVTRHPEITEIVHLAAQAGVRYSLENPYVYLQANTLGQLTLQEAALKLPKLRHLLFASTSSVYGANSQLPFSIEDRVDRPVSVYAASKRAAELLAHTYAHLYGLPLTGLRFFTVYGPWGRPDMAYWSFAEKILDGRTIEIFNGGDMQRDFTYIDDIVAGVLAAIDRPAQAHDGQPPFALYNLGNNRPEPLLHFVEVLERLFERQADKRFLPMQAGDVQATYADIEASRRDLGFAPRTDMETGLAHFAAWFKDWRAGRFTPTAGAAE
ncbi:SDR family NAD(P)-dependent oxidoreductase [Algihabitans albus]|uniref:SDR family NAD(P)-dependent oxidoreductase n=1 Tax=Algihabitans albus TaxID=2164067 RepID=UPI0035D0E444